jgi:DNA-binding XRE family transcriptional regulator
MSRDETRVTWRELRVVRKAKGYTQVSFGRLLGMSQSAVSLHETDHADESVDPELARRALEAPVAPGRETGDAPSESQMPEAETAFQGAAPAQTWPLILVRGPLPAGTVLVETGPLVSIEAWEAQTRSFSAVRGRVPPLNPESGHTLAQVRSTPARAPAPEGSTSNARGRFTLGFAVAASLAVFALTTGCMLSHRKQGDSTEPRQVHDPDEHHTGNETTEMGTRPKASIQMPDKPYEWQKLAPCSPGETEKLGGCWFKGAAGPPCPDVAVEDAGACYVPIPAKPKRPNTMTPKH